MGTLNHWFKTNIHERMNDPHAHLQVTIADVKAKPMDFLEACYDVAYKIRDLGKPIYVPLSGGIDSEFVLKIFLDLNIPVTPVIVSTPANTLESAYAFHYCKKRGVKPIVLEYTEAELVKIYYEEIFKKLNGKGFNSVAVLLAGQYIEEQGGVAIVGEHIIDDDCFGVNEWDFYNDVLIHPDNSLYFFIYTPEIVYAMAKARRPKEPDQEFKLRLYGLEFRPKIKYIYSRKADSAMYEIRKSRKIFPIYNVNLDHILELLGETENGNDRTSS
jgi:hypothetical protein